MTTIKIPFTKKSIKQISASKLAPGTKGLELEIQSDFLMSQLCSLKNAVGNPTDSSFEKITFVFKDDGGQLVYDSLNENQNFELIFDEEKVWLNVDGFGNFIDESKPEINMRPGSKSQETNYTPWLIGGGVLIFIIVILALVGMTKSNRD